MAARAADTGVCGDGAVDTGEQCDDGNLHDGDGCSAVCTLEECGNGIVDQTEQCDAAGNNGKNGSMCDAQCHIRFCGNSVTDSDLGEQCDDGNNVDGDGCSSTCQLEGAQSSSSSVSTASSVSISDSSSSVPPVQASLLPIDTQQTNTKSVSPKTNADTVAQAAQVRQVAVFLTSPGGEDFKQYLNHDQSVLLDRILQKLTSGERLNLTAEERTQAAQIAQTLSVSIDKEQARYADILKQFIITPISADVVQDENLSQEQLGAGKISVTLVELKKMAKPMDQQQVRSDALAEFATLKRQGVDLTDSVQADALTTLQAGARPIEIFGALRSIKEAMETQATKDLPASIKTLQAELAAVRLSLPALAKTQNIDIAQIEPLLASVEEVVRTSGKNDSTRIANAVSRLVTTLERQGVVSKADLVSLPSPHAAATLRLADELKKDDRTVSADVPSLLSGLAASAPDQYRAVFTDGSADTQRDAIVMYLKNDSRLTDLRATLRAAGQTDMDARYLQLLAEIANVGTNGNTETTCDDSVQDALLCTHQYLSDVQDAARSLNPLTKLIGTLQDYFGIGQ